MIFAIEQWKNSMGFLAARFVELLNSEQIRRVTQRSTPNFKICTDVFTAFQFLAESGRHNAKATPSDKMDKYLRMVHFVISNLKNFQMGTYHGVTHRHHQEYINKFVFQFNHRFRKPKTERLLQAIVNHVSTQTSFNLIRRQIIYAPKFVVSN